MCDETSTTTIPDAAPEEKALLKLATDGLMTSYLEESGYDVTKTETKFDDSPQYESIKNKKSSIQAQIVDLENQLSTLPQGTSSYQNEKYRLDSQINAARNALVQADSEEAGARAGFSPEIEYKTRKKSSLEAERIGREKGLDSPEFLAAQKAADLEKEQIEKLGSAIQIQSLNMADKFFKGDYTLNASQNKFVSDILGPVKEAGLNAVKYFKDEIGLSGDKLNEAATKIGAEYQTTGKAMLGEISEYAKEVSSTGEKLNAKLTEFKEQVKATGMSMGTAIIELEKRTKQTGVDMKAALDESLSYSKALTEMGIKDFSLATRNSIAEQAASLGRSPSDPQFVKEMQDQVTKEIQRTGLQFGQMSAEGKMAIAQRTGAGMEEAAKLGLGVAERTGAGMEEAARTGMSITERTGAGMEEAARLRLGVAERTGAGMEGVAGTKFGIAERTSAGYEEAAKMRGQVEVGAAEAEANMRTQIGMQQVPGSVGLGMNIGQYQQSIEQTRLANAQAAAQAPMGLIGYYQGERMAQPTTTKSSSPWSTVAGIAGLGMQAAGTAYGMGAFGGGGGK